MNEVILSHTDTIIDDFHDFAIGVVLYLDLKFRLISEDIGIGDCQEAYLVERIRGVRDEFSEENFFLGVEGVDDDVHQSM